MLDKINYKMELQELEIKLLDIEFRKSNNLVGQLLTDDFIEFGSSGCIYSKSDVIAGLKLEVHIKRKLRDFNAKILANNIVLVTYIVASYNNADVEESASLRSSIWRFDNNSWKMIFHQGTYIKDPIILEKYDNDWLHKGIVEINLIKDKCKFDWIMDIQHIGSTAIAGIKSKPIIDIMIGVKNISEARQLIPIIESLGYVFWLENPKKDRLFFVKGMPPFGKQRTHHIHVCEFNCDEWNDRLVFRDYLNTHEHDRLSYEMLKIKLATEFSSDREQYTNGKTSFIKNIMQKIYVANSFTLVIGDKKFSSWSLRAWLALKIVKVNFTETIIELSKSNTRNEIKKYSSSAKVPILIHNSLVIHDSLAICEYLNDIFPEANLLSDDIEQRAIMRSLCAEMHSGFAEIRKKLPFRLSFMSFNDFNEQLLVEIERVTEIFDVCLNKYQQNGGYLFGKFSMVDIMFAPIILRFKYYGINIENSVVSNYIDKIYQHDLIKEWILDGDKS